MDPRLPALIGRIQQGGRTPAGAARDLGYGPDAVKAYRAHVAALRRDFRPRVHVGQSARSPGWWVAEIEIPPAMRHPVPGKRTLAGYRAKDPDAVVAQLRENGYRVSCPVRGIEDK